MPTFLTSEQTCCTGIVESNRGIHAGDSLPKEVREGRSKAENEEWNGSLLVQVQELVSDKTGAGRASNVSVWFGGRTAASDKMGMSYPFSSV